MSHKVMNGDRPGSFFLGTHQVARVGFGAMQIERMTSRPEDAAQLLRQAIDLGADHVDTAQFYGNGFVNDVIRKVLPDRRELVVVTKVGADPDPGKAFPIKSRSAPRSFATASRTICAALGSNNCRSSTCVGWISPRDWWQRATRSSTSMINWRR
jgi:hypothetical protein